MNYRTVLAIFVNSIVICLLVFLLYKLTAQPKTKVVEDGKYWTVETKLGQIRGIRKTSLLNNIDFYAFRGVPYAKSPTGELRFKAPEPVEPWKPKVLDALRHASTCIRSDTFSIDNGPKSEDCLVLNVYVPVSAEPNNTLAVMFWIHGGSFYELSGNDHLFGPDFLIEQDVIVVTINYRLGVFGFLSLDTPEYSGNMGLKDQQMALKWVYENIDQFYGDKHRITIFGESAGGASTHFQVLSSESRKYFRNAIVMSGTAENIWSISDQKNHIDLAYEMAKTFNVPTSSFDHLVEFLKTADALEIVNSVSYFELFFGTIRLTYAPIVERKDAKMPFLTEAPSEVYKTSNIDKDVIFYHTSSEMLVLFNDIYVNLFGTWEPEQNITLYLPFVDIPQSTDSNEYRMLEQELRQFYFGNASIDANTSMTCVDMLSDSNFVYPNYKSMRNHMKYSKNRSFYMRFSVDWTLNGIKRKFYQLNSDTPGASHADEMCYLFRSMICQATYEQILANRTSQESKVSLRTIENITKLFSNFAKYGEPTYKNEPIAGYGSIQNDDILMLDINNDGLEILPDPKKMANEFWYHLEERAHQLLHENTS